MLGLNSIQQKETPETNISTKMLSNQYQQWLFVNQEIKCSEMWTKTQLISFKKKAVNVPSGAAAMFVQASMWVKWEWVNNPARRL